ncbi:MAG: glycine/betaine ABC transporter substrate-binding protein [Treponema sp.]|nr:glycine/betaine ABC transporter substrate-binding protein [Treponema sp.]
MKKITMLLAALLLVSALFTGCGRRGDTIVIGAKDFTEQFILGYALQILIDENTDLNTRLVSNLGTWPLFRALSGRRGDVDLYVEYTGTVVVNIFGDTPPEDSEETFQVARRGLRERYNVIMLDRLGFNNTYTLAVREDTAEQLGLRTISDLARVAPGLTIGATVEFMGERPDGFLGAQRVYGLNFANEVVIQGALRYTAIMNNETQVTDAFSTDGMLLRFNLVVLEDDLGFFPAYHAAVIIRADTAERHPELVQLLNRLTGTLSDDRMRELNYRVDALHQSPQAVARDFLREAGLIGN